MRINAGYLFKFSLKSKLFLEIMATFTKTKLALSLDGAKHVAKAAVAEATNNGWNITVAILDEGGNLVYLERMDGCQTASIQVAQTKADSAFKFKRPTKALNEMVASGNIAMMSVPGCLPVEGGLPITVEGQIVGAIGISGVTSAQDGVVAAAGVRALENM